MIASNRGPDPRQLIDGRLVRPSAFERVQVMSRIRILPEDIANQIAAGEVVERPASVVKELVENAIDAGATEIFVDIEKGGRGLVRVTDNGCGMSRDDAFLSLERHATSKVKTAEDLFALHTMGFRGEALPAIASVSRLRLTTRSLDEESGWQIYAEGGTIRQADAVGAPAGTVVEVRSLFFNTPGRRKFLRKEETEFGHIAEMVTRLALSRPDIHIRLTHDGRTVVEAYRHKRLEERTAALLGRQLVGELLPVEADSGQGELLVGLLGAPGVSRSTTSHVYAYVNGRYVRDRVIQHAILDAYRTLLEKRRYPVAVLFLDLPPGMVDVNVHPTKHEVRFRNQQQVHDFIVSTLRRRLMPGEAGVSQVVMDPAGDAVRFAATAARSPQGDEHRLRIQESLAAFNARVASAPLVTSGPLMARSQPSVKGEAFGWTEDAPSTVAGLPDGWRLIGQYLSSYLVCQSGDDLILIDQHAAHERLGFERLRAQLDGEGIASQALLFPIVIELDHREAVVFGGHLPDFSRFGFEIDDFGGRSFSVKAVPALLGEVDVERLVRDLAAELGEIGRAAQLDAEIERVLAVIACHGMVRANQSLSTSEMQRLISDIAALGINTCCPHGRPVARRLSRREVETFFRRG